MTNELDARTLSQLRLMADKLQSDPTTMAWILTAYQKQEKFSFHKLSMVLKTSEAALTKLALCKRPDTNSDDFGSQVAQIADYAEIDLILLTNLIRQVESVIAFSENSMSNRTTVPNSALLGFTAARDKGEELPNDEDTNETGKKDNVADK